jgi:DNA-binding transcriptional regulator WhiA
VSLLDDLGSIGNRKNECTAGLLLKSLSEKESAALLKVIDNPDTSLTMLARVLSKHGHEISRKTLNRHRLRGQKEIGCVCP